jgi:hypothetical protein
MIAYNQDLDALIGKLRSNDPKLMNNLMDVTFKMVVVGYGQEFVTFLFEIIDQGFQIEIIDGNYNKNEILDDFDTSLLLDEKMRILSVIGNDNFEDFAIISFSNQKHKSLVMINSFVRLVINCRYYLNVFSLNK